MPAWVWATAPTCAILTPFTSKTASPSSIPKKCTACGNCVNACPRHVIQLKPKDASVLVRCQNADTGRVAREACMKACIGCKRCEKECKYDAIHVENGFARIDTEKCTRCGACAAVCPCKCITID